jgi:hypothetical protein
MPRQMTHRSVHAASHTARTAARVAPAGAASRCRRRRDSGCEAAGNETGRDALLFLTLLIFFVDKRFAKSGSHRIASQVASPPACSVTSRVAIPQPSSRRVLLCVCVVFHRFRLLCSSFSSHRVRQVGVVFLFVFVHASRHFHHPFVHLVHLIRDTIRRVSLLQRGPRVKITARVPSAVYALYRNRGGVLFFVCVTRAYPSVPGLDPTRGLAARKSARQMAPAAAQTGEPNCDGFHRTRNAKRDYRRAKARVRRAGVRRGREDDESIIRGDNLLL